jgi:proteasome assembly chaperone (PAC2) family protein
LSGERSSKSYREAGFQSSSLVVGWSSDAGKLGPKVTDYLNRKLDAQKLAEIEPTDFFPLGGVSVEDDVAQFPESKFYRCEERNLVIFKGDPPRAEWYEFLNSVLDIAEHCCHVKELYTIGGMVSFGAHTAPRELLAVANSPEVKKILSRFDIVTDMDYETSPGQRPTISSFLLWVAKRRNIAGASLWVPIPFYLIAVEDPEAWRRPLEFFDTRFGLGIDFTELDEDISRQREKIAQARIHSPEIDDCIRKLESNISLTREESEKLVVEIEEFLTKRE